MTERLRIEIFPVDLDRTVDFYVRVLRFELLRDERTGTPRYASMRRGEVHVGALGQPVDIAAAARRPPAGVELVLEVDELEPERELILAAGWALEEDITARPWGLRDFRLLDPDGHYWRITTRFHR
jgi:predicted enzyme related to lactoylglutathione lyase